MNVFAPESVIIRDSDRSRAAHACVPVSHVTLTGGHLADRMAVNRSTSIPGQYAQLVDSGRLRNFERAAGQRDDAFEGIYFNDSDVYKWLEAACWSLATEPADDLQTQIADVVALIAAAQQDDGYLNTWFQTTAPNDRFTNLKEKHELYCAGHLIQAAIAHKRVTDSDELLNVAVKFADLLVDSFGPGKIEAPDGHPEIELALVELFRQTGNDVYLSLAEYFIFARGKGLIGGDDYLQDATPLTTQRAVVGHAVRAVYLNAGATDLIHESIQPELRRAVDAMLANMLERRSYITGGIGSRWEGEAFGLDYELPNNRAYAESCAAIGAAMWVWRMLMLEAKDDSYLADVFERILYNAILPGVSLEGDAYFYQNPLRDEDGSIRRTPWFNCACCPPNIARFIAQLPGYVASVTSRRFGESDSRHDQLWIHQYVGADLNVPLLGGGEVSLTMDTRYPFDGDIEVEITDLQNAGDFTLEMRVPDWAFNAKAWLNGDALPDAEAAPGQYLTIRRNWQVGDKIRLNIPMPVRRIVAHPRVANNAGRVALMRGPLVYCVEEPDNEIGDVRDIVLDDDVQVTFARRPELLGDVVVLSAHAMLESPAPAWNRALYRNLDTSGADRAGRSEVQIHAIPYMLWANRGAGPMTVWIRRA